MAGFGFLGHAFERVRVARASGAICTALGVGVLLLYGLARPLGYEGLLAGPERFAAGIRFDGRMSPNAALSYVVLGFALSAMGSRRLWLRALVLAAAFLLAVSLTAFCGYLTGLRHAPEWWRFTGMAIHTSVGFLLAASGVLVWTVRRVRLQQATLAPSLPFFASAGAVVIVLGVVSFATHIIQEDSLRAIAGTWEVRLNLDRFTTAMARAEMAAYDAAATGGQTRMDEYRSARQEAVRQIDILRTLVMDRPVQSRRVRGLGQLAARRLSAIEGIVRSRLAGGTGAGTRAWVDPAPEATADLLLTIDELRAEETRLFTAQEGFARSRRRAVRVFVLSGAVLSLVLGATAFQMLRQAQGALQDANDSLERRVGERTRELEESARTVAGNERNLRFLADTMPQLVWTAKPSGEIESLNRRWCFYLGVEDEAQALAAWKEVVHPDDRREMETEWAAMLREERIGIGELRLRRADGEYRWHLWRGHPQRDETGRVLRWVGTSTDIQEQKLFAAELEQRVVARSAEVAASEERFRNAFEFAGVGMAIVGLDGRWLRVNRSICEIVGYPEPELLKKTFQDITHPDDLDADLAHVQDLIEGKQRYYHMEKRYFHREGQVVWIRLTASLVRAPNGAPLHFVSQIEDVTARKKLEASLGLARDQAMMASRLKSEFLANMSHEIRTPMNGIMGMTGLLIDSPLNDEQREMMRLIQTSAESLLTIIDDILDFSKIEAGKLRIDPQQFDLRDVVEETLALFARRAHEKRLELIGDLHLGLDERMLGDAGRIRQVLTNLLGNATKFTERGEVVVRVVPLPAAAHRHAFRVEVRDTGIGVAVEARTTLFEPFTQADGTTTRRFGGTGLGLAISRQLIELMGGTIGFESEVGRGSVFWFELDLPLRNGPPANALPPLPASVRVLVVDDNPTSREVLLGQIARAGATGQGADNRNAALALLRASLAAGQPFQAVLLDWELGGVASSELATEIRQETAFAAVPLVLLVPATSLGDAGHTPQGYAAFLTKPVREAVLHRALARVLADTRETNPAAGWAADAASPIASSDATAGLHLLLVEDNPANQVVTLMQLRKMGHSVDVAANGEQALVRLRSRSYNAVLMDCQLPLLDGYETTRRIRAGGVAGLDPRIPIIAITAYAMEGDRAKCLDAGMNDYVTKPVRIEALHEALLRWGLGRRGPAPVGRTPDLTAKAVLDPVRLDELRGLTGGEGGTFLAEIIALFRAQEPERIAKIFTLANSRAGEELALAAHLLAGSCASLGAAEAQAAAEQIEAAARAASWAEMPARLAEIGAAWERLNEALTKLEEGAP
ncbi:MAG: PAS domain S-box protein [Opitutaceae bacterium]